MRKNYYKLESSNMGNWITYTAVGIAIILSVVALIMSVQKPDKPDKPDKSSVKENYSVHCDYSTPECCRKLHNAPSCWASSEWGSPDCTFSQYSKTYDYTNKHHCSMNGYEMCRHGVTALTCRK